jgi:hypothetical protein
VPREASTSKPRRNQVLKFCQVRRLAWRSQAVTDAFLLLDEHRERKQAGKPLTRAGVQARIRRRAQNSADSKRGAPKNMPKEVFDEGWFGVQKKIVANSLKVTSISVMEDALKKLNQALGRSSE